jgi:hypothetical protein
MSNVTVYFLNRREAIRFYMEKDKVKLVSELQDNGEYSPNWTFERHGEAEDICEYVFDVTNNPARQDEREAVYGRGPSLSVGDIVSVNGTAYLCDSVGWVKVS